MGFNIFFPIQAGFKMAVPLQGILFLGIIPALILLFIFLKGYDGHYSDRGIFLTFMAGIFLGFISALVRMKMLHPPVIFALIEPAVMLFMVLFAFFEQLFKTIILNIGRFQEKSETTIYGLSLGLGFGTVFTPFFIIAAAASADASGVAFTNYHTILITIGTIGIILFHGATGAIIGYGISQRKLLKYLLIAVLLQLPLNVLLDMTRSYTDSFFIYFQVGLIVYGAMIFFYVVTRIMPQILEQNDKNKKTS